MSWGELFDRAASYDVTVAEVRETLAEHRAAGDDDDEAAEDGGDDER
ncbi:hypothetical protein [Haloarchaeobius salinus]|nr:hypothetical protein [Haloarchaeobius salinus]